MGNDTEKLFIPMAAYYAGDPQQIQHFIRAHSFAHLIGLGEGLDDETQHILEVAAIVHDIGIKNAMEKYGSANGNYQEIEGPPVAAEMLKQLGYAQNIIDRVCYLVGHHHTYKGIDGIDYQILVEADFLVNMYEGAMRSDAIVSIFDKIFKTTTGKRYCELMFDFKA